MLLNGKIHNIVQSERNLRYMALLWTRLNPQTMFGIGSTQELWHPVNLALQITKIVILSFKN